MLNLPEAVQDLFRTDSIRKNFRVQFESGTRADLTNQNIVAESVKFTESICSQDVYRIGLAELCVIEFETVGISDMRGEKIRCYCEIDTSTLTASQISAIQANPGDGELVLAAASDLGYGFYRVPYGEFIVSACPRNHENMEHRQVTAYSPDPFRSPNPIETARLITPIWRSTLNYYRPDVALLAIGQLAFHDRALLLQLGFTEEQGAVGSYGVFSYGSGAEFTVQNNSNQTLKIQLTSLRAQSYSNIGIGPGISDTIIGFELSTGEPYSFFYLRKRLLEDLQSLDVKLTTATITNGPTVPIKSFEDFARLVTTGRPVVNGVRYGTNPFYALYPFAIFADTNYASSNADSRPFDAALFTATCIGAPSWIPIWYIGIPCSYEIKVTNQTTGQVNYYRTFVDSNSSPVRQSYTYSPPADLPLLGKRLDFTNDDPVIGQSNFWGAYDMGKLITDYLEIMGCFSRPSRLGGSDVFALSDDSPFTINRPDYESVWWDEYAGETIGLIRFTIKLSDTENTTLDYRFGDGLGVYDMSDNNLFVETSCTKEEAIATLQAHLVPALNGLALGTVELEGRGQPELESGDFLRIQAAETTLSAYITRQSIAGEQRLKNSIEQVGELLETQEGFV